MGEERKALQVMLTEEQRKILDAAAEERGLATSAWLRSLGLKAAQQPSGAKLSEAIKQALTDEG